MKWKEKTPAERHIERRNYYMGWHRVFAWFAIKDEKTRMFYKWQYVWRRAIKFRSDDSRGSGEPHYSSYCDPVEWEVREGPKDAPEFVQCPTDKVETSV